MNEIIDWSNLQFIQEYPNRNLIEKTIAKIVVFLTDL